MPDTPTFTGHCGAVQYAATGKPMFKAQCHCRECQYISGGGPNYYMIPPADGMEWTQAPPHALPAPT